MLGPYVEGLSSYVVKSFEDIEVTILIEHFMHTLGIIWNEKQLGQKHPQKWLHAKFPHNNKVKNQMQDEYLIFHVVDNITARE